MGLLCDLFVTTHDDALKYESTTAGDPQVRLKRYSPAEFKGFTTLEFGTLWAILEGKEWDVKRHMLIDVAFGEGNESWLHQFQEEYVTILSRLEEKDIERVSTSWAVTEELSCSPDDLRPVVETLIRLSKESLASGSGLYMWGSL